MTTRVAKVTREIYRGYMPENLGQNRPPQRIKPWWKVVGKPRVTLYPKKEIEGYSEEPEYPPLNDGSKKGVRGQVRLDWYESLKSPPTSEAKLHEIAKHGEHYIAHFDNWPRQFNSLPMIQYLTHTHFVDSLPESYSIKSSIGTEGATESSDQHDTSTISLVRQVILNQIALYKYQSQDKPPSHVAKPARVGGRDAYRSNLFIQNLVQSVKCALSQVNPELIDYQIDLSPAIRSWWYHSGFAPPNNKVFYKSRKDDNGNINQMIQMNGASALNYRAENFIEPILPDSDPLVTDLSLVPKANFPLKHYSASYRFKSPVALPGFWFEEKPRFDMPHTCFLNADCLELRNRVIHKVAQRLADDEDCLNGQAIMSGFGWLNSLSMYHGFTPFQELEYPSTCQLVTTDGKNWMFHVYQLNSHTFHRDLGGPKKNNICWSSGNMRLYDTFEDGQFRNINDDVVKLLVRFMSQKTSPEYTAQLNLRPYLSEDLRSENEIDSARRSVRYRYEQRTNRWLKNQWKVALWEHLFFRSKPMRHRITETKATWHVPTPKYPKIFD